MLSLQELSDRVELEQLSSTYANAIDSGNWDGLDDVFTPDAYIDYRALGGIDGRFPAIKKWLSEVLPKFPRLLPHGRQYRDHVSGGYGRGADACASTRWIPRCRRGFAGDVPGALVRDRFARTRGLALHRAHRRAVLPHNVPAHMAAPKRPRAPATEALGPAPGVQMDYGIQSVASFSVLVGSGLQWRSDCMALTQEYGLGRVHLSPRLVHGRGRGAS